ncbi:MAG: hypothetical protein M3Q24_01100 [bacterium]|nr:hypothetical protein [bacterium]
MKKLFHSRSFQSVFLSVALISGALWVRYDQANAFKDKEAELLAVRSQNQKDTALVNKELFGNLNPNSENKIPLSETDLVGRQLFTEYMNLSSKGQATPENLNKLAEKYAKNIISLDKSAYINESQIKIIPDTESNLQFYGQTIFEIRAKYAALIKDKSRKNSNLTAGSPEFSKFMLEVSVLYKTSSNEVRNTPVPEILKKTHLDLVNNYISSSNAAKELSDITKDPVSAYAALNTQAKNSEGESSIFLTIEQTMRANGLPMGGIGI